MLTFGDREALARLEKCQRCFREDIKILIELEKLKSSGTAKPEDYDKLKERL
jgi:hypothetical protein